MSYSSVIIPSIAGGADATLVRRDADDAIIPVDPLNHDWQAYQAWLEAGNTPAAPDCARASSKPA